MNEQLFRGQRGVEILLQEAAQGFLHIELAQTGLAQRILQFSQREAIAARGIAQGVGGQYGEFLNGSDRFSRSAVVKGKQCFPVGKMQLRRNGVAAAKTDGQRCGVRRQQLAYLLTPLEKCV